MTASAQPLIVASAQAGVEAADDPLWYKDAVIYQAHVKSFFDANDDGVGDFTGLTRKLDYIQALGATCIWLLPFFPSPLKDDGYDIADYLNVHPGYGTLDDFKAFVEATHARKIKVLIELVINHTSDQHPWFTRACQAPPGSPERNFYVWSDTDKKFPETRIIFSDTEKSNWAYDPIAKQYYWHRFFSHQPDLNHNNPAVVDAVIDVMKFWMDLGVDALRLDAVPYLCVREGTTNENLPETHAVLRKMRRALDASYANRMLLAEANAWPADVRAYFGDSDECHMAFHFPLMPRMFLAIRQEDRHAITEILNQTPDLPDACQWALFLRNHDELTLEMVTDEERDYMYQVYAADPQMRLNAGIRRRLAPLVENSRRRVELLHTLLFSLPGTPILYYGDELGMGDNIYLGDRNGVRTPMQWSGDRNAGFSRADPARVFAPPIMDPVYGYQAINVEAQERYPFSLLTWMKRLIATRRQHRVFGRGSLDFIGCPNRKVLAFLRRDERETILVVANLSRTVQPAELDLSACAGLVPVEMNGLTEFPRITDRPFFLSLGPYAAYWFALEKAPMQMAQQPPPAPPDPRKMLSDSLPALLIGTDWTSVLDSASRSVIERTALIPFLERQAWFASKPHHARQARFSDWLNIRPGAEPAFLATVSIAYQDEWQDSYAVPLAFATGDLAARILAESPGAVVTKVAGARSGILFDGWLDDQVCGAIAAMMTRHEPTATVKGAVRGEEFGAGIALAPDAKWVRLPGDYRNSVAVAGDRYFVKMFRRLAPGENPELEIERCLTVEGFTRVPALAGSLSYDRAGLEPGTLAIAEIAVPHQGTAWEFTVDEIGRYYERAAARGGSGAAPAATDAEPPPFFAALEGWYLTNAATLGRRTAELHAELARMTGAAFAPEPLKGAALVTLVAEMRQRAEDTLRQLESHTSTLPESVRPLAARVLNGRAHVFERIERASTIRTAGQQARIHGDYHLGQVLRVDEDFVIIDFEGDPSRPRAGRRAKSSPLKDVAGMTRSFGYAAHAALLAFTVHAPGHEAASLTWAATWEHWVTRAFLGGYKEAMGGSPLIPDRADFSTLLDALVVDKALSELAYELSHRPDWTRIPLAGLASVLQS
ncbi:MAG TPA: maltose alpha-D-glucosyltransferase [Vicinamibacterales bacterium]|nr:maltose alpha-D-glucosyltransferase [Vicinamibacterales bacterium]